MVVRRILSMAALALLVAVFIPVSTSVKASGPPVFPVINTSEQLPDGVWFRNSPTLSDTNEVTGFGVYAGDSVQLICYAFGGPVGPYNDSLWYYADNLTGPLVSTAGLPNIGYLNAHYINDGMAARMSLIPVSPPVFQKAHRLSSCPKGTRRHRPRYQRPLCNLGSRRLQLRRRGQQSAQWKLGIDPRRLEQWAAGTHLLPDKRYLRPAVPHSLHPADRPRQLAWFLQSLWRLHQCLRNACQLALAQQERSPRDPCGQRDRIRCWEWPQLFLLERYPAGQPAQPGDGLLGRQP